VEGRESLRGFYGAANLIPVDGKLSDDLEDYFAPRTQETLEPAFYHSFPISFYLELLHVFPITAIIDLTPGEGGHSAPTQHRVGLCMTPSENQRLLRERLDVLALAAMFEEGHAYDAMALAAVKSGDSEGDAAQASGRTPRTTSEMTSRRAEKFCQGPPAEVGKAVYPRQTTQTRQNT
jgi:hypothetical protein